MVPILTSKEVLHATCVVQEHFRIAMEQSHVIHVARAHTRLVMVLAHVRIVFLILFQPTGLFLVYVLKTMCFLHQTIVQEDVFIAINALPIQQHL